MKTQEYIAMMGVLFASDGWRELLRDAEKALDERKELALAAKTLEELYFYKGEASQLATLLTLEQQVAQLRADLDSEGE